MLNESRVLLSISKSLKTKITINSSVNNIENWDSIGHLQILANLDKLTKGKISKIEEFSEADSVKSIIKILKKKKMIK